MVASTAMAEITGRIMNNPPRHSPLHTYASYIINSSKNEIQNKEDFNKIKFYIKIYNKKNLDIELKSFI